MDKSKVSELKRTARAVVARASKSGGALEDGTFTMAIARRSISRKMGLGETGLDGVEWKSLVKKLVAAALEEGAPSSPPQASSPAAPSAEDASDVPGYESDDEEDEEEEEAEYVEEDSPRRSKKPANGSTRRKNQSISSEHDESAESNNSGDVDSAKLRKGGSTSKRTKLGTEKSFERPQGPKSAKCAKAATGSSTNDVPDGDAGALSAGKRKSTAQSIPTPEDENGSVDDTPNGDKSESEMSSLYDVAPTKRRKSEGKGENASTKKESKQSKQGKESKAKRPKKDPNEGLTPDEARVADLKKIVVACGVRKQWSKEFADLPTAKEQKRHLEGILSSLGMRGAPSLGKAKALKEKRELAAELDDVVEFEAARGVGNRSSRSKSKKTVESSTESEGSETPPKDTFGEILDFLGDDESD